MRVLKTSELNTKTTSRDQLICINLSLKPLSSYEECDFDATPPTAVFVRNTMYGHELDNIVHTFKHLEEKFGPLGSLPDVFELFGTFEPNAPNAIFSDNAPGLETPPKSFGPQTDLYERMDCRKYS